MAWYIPLVIFLARIGDVSIGTVRSMLVIAGHQVAPAILGFFEVMIWVLAVGWALKYLDESIFALVAYAGGYASGVMIGVWVEERLALGYRIVRIISPQTERELSRTLRERGFRVTRVDAHGRAGPVELAFLVIRRRRLRDVREVTRELAPEAFVTVERVDAATGGGFTDANIRRALVDRFFPLRK